MILRPVRPQSPIGPPISNLPVGLTRKFAFVFSFFSSKSYAGRIGCTTCSQRSGLISVSESTPGLCCVEMRIFSISIGLASELVHSLVAAAWHLKNTTDSTAATHFALIGGAVFGGFAGLHYWFPKMTGRTMGENLARISFWTILLGLLLGFVPLFFASLAEEGRRTAEAYGWERRIDELERFYMDVARSREPVGATAPRQSAAPRD